MTVGTIFGIPVRVDWSWLLVFAFFVWGLSQSAGVFSGAAPSVRLAIAGATVLLLFVCVVLHELAHALVARRFGASIREIELFAFGGVSRIEHTGTTPAQEAAIALVGPATSVAIGIAFAAAAALVRTGIGYQALAYLAAMNVILAAFNMLPSYPLDGARALHALVWAIGKRRAFAVSFVSTASTISGLALIAGSLTLFFSGFVTSGVWTAFLAWFIMRAARAETTNELYVSPLGTLRCSQIADEPPDAIEPDTTCAAALARMIATRRRALPVAVGDRLVGLVTLSDFAKLEQRDPAALYVNAIMTARGSLVAVAPALSALDAFRTLSDCGFHQLPVLENGALLGFISGDTFHRVLTFAREERAMKGLPRCVHSS